jgi:Na+/melibiose symporter-like transporter
MAFALIGVMVIVFFLITFLGTKERGPRQRTRRPTSNRTCSTYA